MRLYLAVVFALAVVSVGGCAREAGESIGRSEAAPSPTLAELHQQAAEALVKQWYVFVKRRLPEYVRVDLDLPGYPEELKARMGFVLETEFTEERFISSLAPSYAKRYTTEQLESLRQLIRITDGRSEDQLTDHEQIALQRVFAKFNDVGLTEELQHQFYDLYEIHVAKVFKLAMDQALIEERNYEAEHGPLPYPARSLDSP